MINFLSLILLNSKIILLIFIIIRIFIKYKDIKSYILWYLILYIFPKIGIIFYFFFGEIYSKTQYTSCKAKKIWFRYSKLLKKLQIYYKLNIKNIYINKRTKTLFQLCENKQNLFSMTNNSIKLLSSSFKLFTSLITDIQSAKYSIHIVFYIWLPGGLVNKITESIIIAAKRGVKCYIMLDYIGSKKFFYSSWYYHMLKTGIFIIKSLNITIFNLFSSRIDLRQHKKIILIDNKIVYVGSMNMIDLTNFKKNTKINKWFDLMIRITGPIVNTISIIYSYDWEIETGQNILSINQLKKNFLKYQNKSNINRIQVVFSGLKLSKKIIHNSLITAIFLAKKSLIITTPYFIPSKNLLSAIYIASERGVNVQIIIPKYNDSIFIYWASKFFFYKLLKLGVKIYQLKKGFLHTKSIIIDKKISFIGTVNLDIRSIYLNFEINLIIDDINFNKSLLFIQNKYISKSQKLEYNLWIKRPYWKKIIEKLFFLFKFIL
ncbi:cardiolipin synthase [Enterobacteriaceae endosymbiont of Donacia bicoloricornis]|uniref:cardiolipin synthase n=1 Tax=Enterobacteriaceae endosymbiont of Donacia bicoloricornis TaxID=2675772 RepID=UPI001449B340|nr:cardiolipin synthase [Enterobacteriaceae endosymbiont of Donacia bicoloricornis]QJC37632.1 cardiolipin synthase [Enterobacteriaceae endosymbiont of Donacia bicoloricornis]